MSRTAWDSRPRSHCFWMIASIAGTLWIRNGSSSITITIGSACDAPLAAIVSAASQEPIGPAAATAAPSVVDVAIWALKRRSSAASLWLEAV